MRAGLVLTLGVLAAGPAHAFLAQPGFLRGQGAKGSMVSQSARVASHPLALKMLDADKVAKFVEQASGDPPKKSPTKIQKALKKASGAIMVGTEFSQDCWDNAGPDAKYPEEPYGPMFRQFSVYARRNKAACLLVDCSTPSGLEDLENLGAEQISAKGDFPGPVPLVRSGGVSTVEQVAEAKAAGADGVLVSWAEDNAAEVVSACLALGMEPLTLVSDKDQIEGATDSGSKILVADATSDVDSAVALRDSIPKTCTAVALLDGRVQGGPNEIAKLSEGLGPDEDEPTPELILNGQKLKDAKFNSLLVAKACAQVQDKAETGFHGWVLTSLLSKTSAQYAKLIKSKVPSGTGGSRSIITGNPFTTFIE